MTRGPGRPPQLTDWHLAGEAFVYVRQSSPEQVRDHTGSAAVQRSQVEHLEALGFPKERIQVIDEDTGQTGTSTRHRTGLQGLMEEIKAGRYRVGAMSELSRMGRDEMELARFLMLCEVMGVLLLDNGIPRDVREVGDWTLMKLQAVMAEGENRRKTQRCQAARLAKARQGVPVARLPVGLERGPHGEAVKIANAEVREVLGRIWREAGQGRTLGEIGRQLRAEGRGLPTTDHQGKLRWVQVTRAGLHRILRNPLYAGQIVLYRHRTERGLDGKREVRTKREEQEWIPGKIEAYVSLGEFQRVQELLASRSRTSRAPLGKGDALCAGLLRCGLCGCNLYVAYTSPGRARPGGRRRHHYVCKGWRTRGDLGTYCLSVGGRLLDSAIAAIVLQQLRPPSLANLRRAIHEENERRQANSRLVAAEVGRAQARAAEIRAYLEESRSRGTNPRVTQLYADELEGALLKKEAAERRAATTPPPVLVDTSPSFLAEVTAAFQQLPQLWNSGRLGPKERRAIVGQVIQRIDILEKGESVRIQVLLHTGTAVNRTLFGPKARRRTIEALAADGQDNEGIAAELRRRGILNGYGEPFTARTVEKVLGPRNRLGDLNLHAALEGLWKTGLSAAKIARQLNDRAFRNHLGKPWTDMTVKNLAKRLGLPRRWQPHHEAIRDAVYGLSGQGLNDRGIAQELNSRGLTTYWRRPWTRAAISRARRTLGIMRQASPQRLSAGTPEPIKAPA